MRFAERFLVVFALISILMRLLGIKDAPTLELISIPLLAIFYIIAMPFLLQVVRRGEDGLIPWGRIMISIFFGALIAYCLISLMMFTLDWLPKMDMLENCCILLGLLSLGGIVGWRKGKTFIAMAGLRAAILLIVVLLMAILPLPHIGSLSRGAF